MENDELQFDIEFYVIMFNFRYDIGISIHSILAIFTNSNAIHSRTRCDSATANSIVISVKNAYRNT